jgi:uroporphyrin-3 C-methyltransferase
MTDNKKPVVTEKATPSKVESATNKNSDKKPVDKKVDTKKSKVVKEDKAQPKAISKLAILAIIIAVGAPAGHYFWQQQQHQLLTQQLDQKNKVNLNNIQTQVQKALNNQQSNFSKQLQQVKQQTASVSQEKIAKLNETVSRLEQRIKQRQPSDWLLHETEYLIRVAARSLWLEQDTAATVSLLKEADSRLNELNDPAFLPARELIHQDIKSLQLMPTLQTDKIILSLMAMNKQVAILPLAKVDVSTDEQPKDFELSDDINDWQNNLTKTWQKFLNDFIRVRQRAGTVEPLIAPVQQENLKQNLSLKIQLALWAASEGKNEIYHKSLTDIESWLNEFFAMEHEYNQSFMENILALKNQKVSYDYSNDLASLPAIRAMMKKQMSSLAKQTTPPSEAQVNEAGENNTGNDTNNEGEL